MKQGLSKSMLAGLGKNSSLKAISLMVAFVFWFVMLGREDITLSRELEVQVLLPPGHILTNQVPKTVTVELVGPRLSLKRFSAKKDVYSLNLANLSEGYHQVNLTKKGLTLPIGLEILAIRPGVIDAVVRKMDLPTDEAAGG